MVSSHDFEEDKRNKKLKFMLMVNIILEIKPKYLF